MLAIDTTATSKTRANTGIQRVTRSLAKELVNLTEIRPIALDNTDLQWRELDAKANKRIFHFQNTRPSSKRGSKPVWWDWILKKCTTTRKAQINPQGFTGLIEPEIFTNRVFSGLSPWLRNGQPSLAIYYDATSMKLPELSPEKNTGRFPAYLQELLHFTGIAAISETSRNEILDYWKWLGIRDHPVVETIPLAADSTHTKSIPDVNAETESLPVVLCVGSIEGRKNQVSLLLAAEKLWEKGLSFQLVLIGLASPETSGPTLKQLQILQDKGRPIKWLGPSSEQELRLQYATSHFTVYPSLAEGFGLPVLESLKHGKPCICSSQGAIGEISNQGGCLTVEQPSPDALADAIQTLLNKPDIQSRLCEEAMGRSFRTWSDYAKDILEFHKSFQESSKCTH